MAINKGKLKRVKKELEKLFSQARYWDFLQRVEAEALGEAFQKEAVQAWRSLVRGAFNSVASLRAFLAKVKEVKALPDNPDIRFLLLIEKFVEGENVAAEAHALKNLSPMPLTMQKRLLSWDEGLSDTKKIEELFGLLLTKPDKVTKKHLAEVTGYFPGVGGSFLDSLPDSFETVRKLNLKGAVARKRNGVDLEELAEIDDELKDIGDVFPKSIYQIIITPFLYQLSLVYENYCREDNDFALEICAGTPFLTGCLTGARRQELESLLMESDLRAMYEADRGSVRKKIAAAGFAERVKLLKNLASSLAKVENDLDDPFDYEDEDDVDADEEAMYADYLFLYKNILAEVGKTRETLSQREQKELNQVMGDILQRDFERFCCHPDDCPEFLKAVAQSGCLDTKFALAGIMVARLTGDRTLRDPAEQALAAFPPPGAKDIAWLMDHFAFLCYPTIANLYPVMRYVREDGPLVDLIVERLTQHVTRNLLQNYMNKNLGKSPFRFLLEEFSPKKAKEEMSRFRRELSNFMEIKGFEPLVQLAESFPEGCITEAGYKKMLAGQYARHGISGVIEVLKDLPASNKLGGFERSMVGNAGLDELINVQANIALELIKEHFDDLRSAPLNSIKPLVDFLEMLVIPPEETAFLIKISNMLHVRKDTGETEAGPIIAKLTGIIVKIGKAKKSGGRRRR